MNAAEVIASVLADDFDSWDENAEANRILAFLKAAGYAVVELPAVGSDDFDEYVTIDPRSFGPRIITGDEFGSTFRSAKEARRFAAALLAAADAAEVKP